MEGFEIWEYGQSLYGCDSFTFCQYIECIAVATIGIVVESYEFSKVSTKYIGFESIKLHQLNLHQFGYPIFDLIECDSVREIDRDSYFEYVSITDITMWSLQSTWNHCSACKYTG